MTANIVHPAELERMLEARVKEARSVRTAHRSGSALAAPRRRRRRGSMGLAAGTLFALVAATVYGVVTTVNIEVAGRTGYDAGKTDEGGIVEYIGDQHTTFGSSGSGIFDAFVRVQADDNESGYNTDGDLEFDTKGGNFTHSIKVSEIPVVPCASLDGSQTGTGLCWELFADLNESDSTKNISLDDFEIYFTTDDELTDYNATWGAPVYASDDKILINDVNQGSGRGDLRYLVPISGITMPSNCDYGNAACATFFVLYSAYGDVEDFDGTPGTSTYDSDGGFEEWKVKRYPFLSVSKTATTSFTRTFAWTIDKSADPATWDLFDGDSGTSDWTVALTKDNGTDSGWAVSGTITINNPSEQTAIIASVTDQLTGGINATVNCGAGSFPRTLVKGATLNCTYSSALPDGTNRTNTASATLTTGPIFTGTAAATFGAPTTVVNGTVDVTDTNGQSWDDVADDASFTYDETFDCAADEGTHNNTATITQTGQSDSASVTVNCYDLDVTKTAVESFSRDFDWTIEKSVDPESLDMFDGDSDDVTWTVEWTKSAAQDSTYAVTGSITIDNNHPNRGAVINSVSDVITTSITATVNCGVSFPHTIAAGGSLVCSYSSNLPDGTSRTNTATATQQNYDYASDLTATADGTTNYSGTASVDFTGVTPTVTDNTATLSDARDGNTIDGDTVSASGSASWDETFECGDDEGSHTNTATVTGVDDPTDTDSDSAMTTVNCYQLTVTKDAATTYSRDYDWSVEKTRFIATGEDDGDGDPLTLTLDEGQTYTASYEITVTMTGFTDDDHAVSGTITVTNPAPIAAVDVVVTDLISPAIAATVDCDGDNTVTIAANDSVDCSYSADLADSSSRTNTATATLFGIGYTGNAGVTFDLANPTTEIDECIDITDDAGTPVDTDDHDWTVCVDDLDANDQWSAEYTIDIGPYAVCGTYEFTNTVSFVTTDDDNDTDESGSDTYTVTVDVPCPQGCTLTQGYWKTHNDSFWGGAPTDETWELIGDADGDGVVEGEGEMFFKSGLTYFQVMWTPPKGNAYFNLATQYIAAKLNMLDGADGSAITTAFNAATTLFQTYTDEEIAALKGKNGNALRAQFISLAGTLGSYNEGLIGPGHCDEDPASGSTAGTTQLLADRRTGPGIG
jgi:hypothetical protein